MKTKKSNWCNIKYKTYDTSEGYGNFSQWQDAFKERFKTFKKESKSFFEYCHTLKELKSEYRNLMKKYHPDIAKDKIYGEKMTKIINESYHKKIKELK